jgi:hypothetical protein
MPTRRFKKCNWPTANNVKFTDIINKEPELVLHEELWKQLAELDKEDTCQRAKCRYLQNQQRYIVTMLNNEYVINLDKKEVLDSAQQTAGFIEQLCLFSYLINAKKLPLANKLVKIQSLPSGDFFFRGPHTLNIEKLEKAFGEKPNSLYGAISEFSAKKSEYGDSSVELLVLPRIPLTFIIWGGDDEFKPRASVLSDKTACQQLPLDALWAMANYVINTLTKPFL